MKKHILHAEKRSLTGRKVKQIRKNGQTPATVYGKKVTSLTVSVKTDDFIKVYKEVGESGVVELTIDKDIHPVLIHSVQKHALSGAFLHAEFHQIDMKEKVKTNVPFEFTGEAPAVAQKLGVLLTLIDEIEVEALPGDLPERIHVDLAPLDIVNAQIVVGDLKSYPGVVFITEPTVCIARIGSLVTKEAEAEVVAEQAAAAESAADTVTTESDTDKVTTTTESAKEEPEKAGK